MDRHDILAALRRNGSGTVEVARQLGKSAGHVAHVISGRDTSKPVARHISKVVGIPVSVLWPGKYQGRSVKQAA